MLGGTLIISGVFEWETRFGGCSKGVNASQTDSVAHNGPPISTAELVLWIVLLGPMERSPPSGDKCKFNGIVFTMPSAFFP
jgi:hypothetical protein